MERKQRRHQNEVPGGTPVPTNPTGREELREHAEILLDAFDEAIDRALSQDSNRFLAANRQQGGQ